MHPFIAARRNSFAIFSKLTALLLIFVCTFPVQLFAQEAVPNISSGESVIAEPVTPVVQNGGDRAAADVDLPSEPVTPRGGPTRADVSGEGVVNDGEQDSESFLDGEDEDSPMSAFPVASANKLTQVDQSGGALVSTYPIKTPPGRGGKEVDLSLVYNSQNSSNFDIAGYGWSLNIPYIERVNKYGSQNLYSRNDFTSSISGELLQISGSNTYQAKDTNGDFLTYQYSSNVWTVYDKSGVYYTFGLDSDSRIASTTKIYRWYLSEIKEPNGNYISYDYLKDEQQSYPEEITYTNFATSTGIFSVEFSYEDRGETMYTSAPGFTVGVSKRLTDISVEEGGLPVRTYDLTYLLAENDERSLINEIIETGFDENQQEVEMPPVVFEYTSIGSKTWTYDSMSLWNQGIDHVAAYRTGDVNGDGLVDILYNNTGDSDESYVLINNGDGFDYHEVTIPVSFFRKGDEFFPDRPRFTQVIDLNGDMFVDLLDLTDGDTYLGNGDMTWTATSSWNIEPQYPESVRLGDINGDNLVDYVSITKQRGGPTGAEILLNTGYGWESVPTTGLPNVPFFTNSNSSCCVDVIHPVSLIDVNNDGLTDIHNLKSGYVYLNNGNLEWKISEAWYYQTANAQEQGVKYGDVNNDGLIDIVKLFRFNDNIEKEVHINTGAGWQEDLTWSSNLPDEWFHRYDTTGLDWRKDAGAELVDFNGDGVMDIYFADEGKMYLGNSNKVDLLESVENIYSGQTEFTYQNSSQYQTGGIDNSKLPINLVTVKSIQNTDSYGTDEELQYEYLGGSYYYNNPHDRKFAGFGLVTETDSVGNVSKTYFHQGNESASTTGEYVDHISKNGKPYRIEKYDSNDDLYAKTINKWDRTDLGNGASFVKLVDTVEFTYDGDSDHKEKAMSFTYDNTTGNLSQKIEFGEVSGLNDGTFSDNGTDKFISSYTYATSTSTATPYIYQPAREVVTDQNSAKIREKKTYYDTQLFGVLTKGNPTKEEFWRTGSSYIDTERSYNTYGLVTQEKDPRDKVTTYDYDAYNLYPATTTNPLGQKTVVQYDYSSGKPIRVKDSNGFVFETTYDGFGRPIEEKQPDLVSPATFVTKAEYEYIDSGTLPRAVHKTEYLSTATSTENYAYLDGFGRVIQSRTEAEDANKFAVSDKQYNSFGKIARESLPYFSTGASSTAATTTAALYVNYEYDPLQRVTVIENAVGETENEYDDWKLTVTDPDGKVKKLYKDAYDNLVRVDEENDASTYTTEYEYDGNKNLVKITDALDNIRNFTYDGLGRRLTAEDLHAPGDIYFGTWTYAYDDAGNMSSITDPKSQVVEYAYDDLNRPLTENYTVGAGYEVQYGYDTCTNGVGRLCSATTTAVVTRNQYNALGGISSEKKVFGVANYETTYTYDRQGNQVSIVDPDHSTTTNQYNSAGQLESITWQGTNDISPRLVVEDFDYAPTGQVAYQKDANGVETTNMFDVGEMYRLTRRYTTGLLATTGTHTDRFYAHDNSGHIVRNNYTSWTDTRNATSGNASSDGTVLNVQSGKASTTGAFSIQRAFLTFDTSNIPSNANIIDASLNLFVPTSGFLNDDNDGDDFIAIVKTTQSVHNHISHNDFDAVEITEGSSRLDLTDVNRNTYNKFVLNDLGKTWITQNNEISSCGTQNGWTCLGVREGHDLIDSEIGTGYNNLRFISSDFSGITLDPYLEVTYEVPGKISALQDLNYTYTDAGDITSIQEKASTTAYRKVDYQYDDLHRLTRASSTRATSNYLETYSYNPIGNLTNKSDIGSYLYTGTTTSNYANPHAPTSIGGTGLTYDNNGNVLTYGTQSNTWNYKNQITQTVTAGATSTMTYDHTGERVSLTENGDVTRYINQNYLTEVSDGKITRYIYANGELVATIKDEAGLETFMEESPESDCCVYNPPTIPVIHYVHNDHLTGSNIVTDDTGALEQTLDYYPFGKVRVDESVTGFEEKHGFTGHYYDEASELSYMGARYQDGKRGQFLSQDAAFLAVGSPKLKDLTSMELQQYLSDPQQLNSYSYTRNNPLAYIDQDGNISFKFSDFANSRPEFSSQQIGSMGYQNLPFYYRQAGDPSGTLRVNDQKIQDVGTMAASLALMFVGSESSVSGLLRESEGLGGHTLDRHVGKTMGDLSGRFGNNFTGQYSTAFSSEGMGDVATYKNIQNNLAKIQTWLDGTSRSSLNLTSTLDLNVGFGVDRSGQVYNRINQVRTVLQKTGNGSGYIIKTSFPKIGGVRR